MGSISKWKEGGLPYLIGTDVWGTYCCLVKFYRQFYPFIYPDWLFSITDLQSSLPELKTEYRADLYSSDEFFLDHRFYNYLLFLRDYIFNIIYVPTLASYYADKSHFPYYSYSELVNKEVDRVLGVSYKELWNAFDSSQWPSKTIPTSSLYYAGKIIRTFYKYIIENPCFSPKVEPYWSYNLHYRFHLLDSNGTIEAGEEDREFTWVQHSTEGNRLISKLQIFPPEGVKVYSVVCYFIPSSHFNCANMYTDTVVITAYNTNTVDINLRTPVPIDPEKPANMKFRFGVQINYTFEDKSWFTPVETEEK